jgi:hypothetical protein
MALRSYLHSTFDPRRIPGLQAWYDAADSASITLDAGRVSQWSDKSGNARHATNTTSGSTQPSYTTAGRNGLNVVTFAAASVQRLTVPSSTASFNFLHNGTDSLVIAVSRYATVANPNAIYTLFGNCAGSSTNRGVFYAYEDRTAASANDGINCQTFAATLGQVVSSTISSGGAILSAYNGLLPAQSYLAQEIVFSAANATLDQRLRVRVDGGTEAAANVRNATASAGNATFDLQIGTAGNNAIPLQGDICELMFFSQLPTAAARDLIRRYLGAKWGVTVA